MDKYLSVRDASLILGIKTRTVREWISTGKIKAVKYLGTNRWFIPESEISRLVGGKENDNKD